MNGLLILLISALVLAGGYWLYGRCVERSWGVDPTAAPPAVRLRDRWDFVATRSWVLLSHECVTACTVLVVFGPILAARYGWLPALLWILLGGVLIGGVQEFCVLYVSVKSRGMTLDGLLGKFAGVRWKKVFLVFAWLLCVLAVAVFADVAARTLDGFVTVDEPDPVRGRAGTVVLMLYAFALLVGLTPEDFPGDDPLAGVRFQRDWERATFIAGGSDYRAPAQTVGDFLLNRPSEGPGSVTPTYRPGVVWGDLRAVLPERITR